MSKTVCTKIFKTWAVVDGAHCLIDTIEYEGKMWLVPGWIDSRSEGWSRPKRIILLETWPHERIASGNPADFLIGDEPIPRTVFDVRIPLELEDKVRVIEHPAIVFYFPPGVH